MGRYVSMNGSVVELVSMENHGSYYISNTFQAIIFSAFVMHGFVPFLQNVKYIYIQSTECSQVFFRKILSKRMSCRRVTWGETEYKKRIMKHEVVMLSKKINEIFTYT